MLIGDLLGRFMNQVIYDQIRTAVFQTGIPGRSIPDYFFKEIMPEHGMLSNPDSG